MKISEKDLTILLGAFLDEALTNKPMIKAYDDMTAEKQIYLTYSYANEYLKDTLETFKGVIDEDNTFPINYNTNYKA